MANPRKFSEKIALHNHRQAEETARFEQIMKEVSDATAKGDTPLTDMVNYPAVVAAAVASRSRSQGGPIRRHDRKLDTSPYSGPYLSPPPDTSWRRTISDSALHQSAMQSLNVERNDNANNRWMMPMMHNGPERNEGRPRSSCEIPRVPGIHIYPSAHVPGAVQIPISGNNTGSLPDLTTVNFSSPIHVPLDQDQDQGSSPYSSSPVNTSPSTLSPTSIPQGMRQQDHFHFTHAQHSNLPTLDNNNKITTNIDNNTDYTQLSGMQGMYQQQCPPTSPSPTQGGLPGGGGGGGGGYRSPRPSPQSSPSLGGRHSAPCSPGTTPSPLPNDYHIFNQHQATQFQQHFEQLSMLDPPVNNNMSYVDQSSGQHLNHTQQQQQHHHQQQQQQNLPDVSANVGNIELTSDGGYYSTSPSSQLVYSTGPPSSLHTTPNTPTSIPDIILTDFSSATDDLHRQQELNKQLENDFFSDESFRESLGPLDFDGLQMLSDPESINLISDSVEDHFRLERS